MEITFVSHALLYGLVLCTCALLGRCADTSYLTSTIRQHFGQNRHHLVNQAYKIAAKEFIKKEFLRFGLETSLQHFVGTGYKDISQVDFYNVIGILKGARFGTSDDRIMGIGAHYDTVETTVGVDDNGAGVAAMLESVRQLTSEFKNFQNTVIFVAFDIEEYMFIVDGVGSQQFVSNWLFDWLQANYGNYSQMRPYGMIILDTMMNYNTSAMSQTIPVDASLFSQVFPKAFNSIKSDNFEGDFLAVIYRGRTDDTELASSMEVAWNKLGQSKYDIEMFALPFKNADLNDKTFQDFLRSDHYHFWRQELPAVFITDSANLRGVMEQCYHRKCDNLDVMLTDQNVRFLGQISDAMTHTIATLSGASADTSGAKKQMVAVWELLFLFLASLSLFERVF